MCQFMSHGGSSNNSGSYAKDFHIWKLLASAREFLFSLPRGVVSIFVSTGSYQQTNEKFERAGKVLKQWHRNLPIMSSSIENIKLIIQFLDIVEEMRDLTLQEWNFRNILMQNLQALLEQQKHIGNKEGISSRPLWRMQARNSFMSTPRSDTSIILLQRCNTRLEMWL